MNNENSICLTCENYEFLTKKITKMDFELHTCNKYMVTLEDNNDIPIQYNKCDKVNLNEKK